ncbi:MAG TPA: hypothetical protein PKN04_07750 [bacterium]|nr:hypothetical protein [bacterium]HNT65651.1 hypothetical protein [bacterium]
MSVCRTIAATSRKALQVVAILSLAMAAFRCDREPQTKDRVLARIGSRTITVDEFIRRAELAVRPPYCRGDNMVHKKIVLNSLIAEKLFALETADSAAVWREERFQFYLQGRKEQEMRRIFYENLRSNVLLKESEIASAFSQAGRIVEVDCLVLPPDVDIPADSAAIALHLSSRDTLVRRRISWSDPLSLPMHDALFQDRPTAGSLVGPISISDGSHLIMRVAGWLDQPALSEQEEIRRRQAVREKLIERKTAVLWEKEVADLLKDKTMHLDRQGFDLLVKILQPLYFDKTAEQPEILAQLQTDDQMPARLGSQMAEFADQKVYDFDGRAVSLGEFARSLQVHPLVFREKKIPVSQFPQHLRLALADLVRDQQITREAYRRGLDLDPQVKRETQLWQDALLAQWSQERSLAQAAFDGLTAEQVVESIFTPYVEELQRKYSRQIEIDVDAFDAIELTGIDLIALQKNVPFAVVVPAFPQLTVDANLDYGRRME